MTRLEDVLRAGLVEQEARSRAAERADAAAATDSKVKQLALDKKMKKPTKPKLQSDVDKRERPAPISSEDLEVLRYIAMTSTETLSSATTVALEFASTFLPAPTSKEALGLLQMIFITKFFEACGAASPGTFNDFYVAAEQIMCYLQFSDDTEEVNWEDYVDLVDGSAPTGGESMDIQASMSSMTLSECPEIGVRAPVRRRGRIGEDEVVSEKWKSAKQQMKKFNRFFSEIKEAAEKFVAYVKDYFTNARRAQPGAQLGELPAGLVDPEELLDFMQGNAQSAMSKIFEVVTSIVPAKVYNNLQTEYKELAATSTMMDDVQYRNILSSLRWFAPELDPTTEPGGFSDFHLYKELLFGEEGIVTTRNLWKLWPDFSQQTHIRTTARDIRAQFNQVKTLLGLMSVQSAEARQYMFFLTGLLALARWFFAENRKRIDVLAKTNGEALRVLTHTIARKYVRGREVYLGSTGANGLPTDSRLRNARWSANKAVNVAREKRFLNDLKQRHLKAQDQWKNANYDMRGASSALSGVLSGQGASTAFSMAEAVASGARVVGMAPGAQEVILATKNVVSLLSYARWRYKAKQALEKLNAALDEADKIKALLEQDPLGNRVPNLAFRREVAGRAGKEGTPGGGPWNLNAEWKKRPKVLKTGGTNCCHRTQHFSHARTFLELSMYMHIHTHTHKPVVTQVQLQRGLQARSRLRLRARASMPRGLKKRKVSLADELSNVNAKLKKASSKKRKVERVNNATAKTNASSNVSVAKPKPGDKSPWWKEVNTNIYDVLPREEDGAEPMEAELAGDSHSWFSVKTIELSNALRPPDLGWRPHFNVEPEDVWSKEAGGDRKAAASRKGKELTEVPLKQTRARAIRIRFVGDREHVRKQEKMLRLWMGAHRYTYNAAVMLVREDKRWLDAKGQYLNEQLVYASKNGWTSKANKGSDEETKQRAEEHKENMAAKRLSLGVQVGQLVQDHPWLLDVPSRIRKNAVRDVIKAEASNEAKRKTDPRHRWTLKTKRRSSPSSWTMGVSSEILSRVEVLPRPTKRQPGEHEGARRRWTRFELSPTYGMGPLWLNEEVPGGKLDKDCKLTLDARGRFYLVMPYEIGPAPDTLPALHRRVGAVDPGDRVQATVYSPNDGHVVQYAVGKNGGGKDRIFHVCEQVDACVGKLDAAKGAVERSKFRKKLASLRARARNLVTEARNKIALDMNRRWDTLILPPFETSGMVKKRSRVGGGPRKIHSKVARSLLSWRHYDFAVHVKNVFLRAGKEVVSPDERYTTMTCGVCGVLGEKHSSEQWTCKHCGAFHLRDPAAARCIFLKAIA